MAQEAASSFLTIFTLRSKFTTNRDYRLREKVVLRQLNDVGRLLFERAGNNVAKALRKHKGSSKYTGVSHSPKNERSAKVWRARIQLNGKLISLGRFETEQEAAAAYNAKATELFGKTAWVNDLGPEQTRKQGGKRRRPGEYS